ncbi:MaoC family dehydratase N-terminal domain-containing protein [Aquamicrobium sp. NLF2-7]|uniref:FAS1-like dehydratase domain-containing protein n=1 Tax=Aquamicrobium sp. NLF2-7 TaxID=2918753 RepID=UPI001EFC14B0|nr:MaoC family dehydratase N-terminal domain-containing protein [Aquamicrobium sp. NLF2-7]MCG8273714.1 MaoC family dehydratase N-terminal domain-containing protein [Aquamicrobium sp. NLF2-7]
MLDLDHLKSWIGTTRESRDVISPRLANGLAAVLDEAPLLGEGDPAPAGIHWCLSPDIVPMSGLGPDGHPARGDFLPPVALPRRMWAGGELVFSGEFRVGDAMTRRSRIADVVLKTGRTGMLCFVTVTHDYSGPRGQVLSERQDIVYRPVRTASAGATQDIPQPSPDASHEVGASPVLLARYSAVTFNGHRIHYDRDYCQREEGYPGLVVHGPLQATYLLRLVCRMNEGRMPARFAFRSIAPLFDGGSFTVNAAASAQDHTLWVRSHTGSVTMQATASKELAA